MVGKQSGAGSDGTGGGYTAATGSVHGSAVERAVGDMFDDCGRAGLGVCDVDAVRMGDGDGGGGGGDGDGGGNYSGDGGVGYLSV